MRRFASSPYASVDPVSEAKRRLARSRSASVFNTFVIGQPLSDPLPADAPAAAAPADAPAAPVPFWRRNLLLLAAAQLISQIGDFLYTTSVVFLVLLLVPMEEGGSWKSAFVSFLHTTPFLLFGFLAGAIADRVDRHRLMLVSDAARALLMLVVFPLIASAGALSWISIGVLAFFLGLAATPFNPARDALVPRLIDRRHLLSANAFFQSSQQIAMILATAMAGAYLREQADEVAAIEVLFVADGCTFLISFVLLSLMRMPPALAPPRRRPPFIDDLRSGLARVARDRRLFWLLVLTAANNFFIMGPAVVGANLFIKNTLELGAAELVAFEMAMALGWLAGTIWLLFGRWRGSRWRLLCIGLVFDGLTYIPFYWINEYEIALVAIALHGVAIPFITGVRTSLIQEICASDELGRVFSLINMTVIGMSSLSLLATGIAGETLAPGTLFLIAGIGGAVTGAIASVALGAITKGGKHAE